MNDRIEIYADGANILEIIEAAKNPRVTGFTTNPTLFAKEGITDYEGFAKDLMRQLKALRPDTNISFEVIADNDNDMILQAQKIHDWATEIGYTAFIKIPVTNTKGTFTGEVIRSLSWSQIPINVTAVFTEMQTERILKCLARKSPTIISIFAGRIADAGIDPVYITRKCLSVADHSYTEGNGSYRDNFDIKFLWASPREVYNVIQAQSVGCDIITMPLPMIKKMDTFGKSLSQFSLETVQMFYNDAVKSGLEIKL